MTSSVASLVFGASEAADIWGSGGAAWAAGRASPGRVGALGGAALRGDARQVRPLDVAPAPRRA